MNCVTISGYINWMNYNPNVVSDKSVLNMFVNVYSGRNKSTGKNIYESIKVTAFGYQAKYIHDNFKEDDVIEINGILCNKSYIDKIGNKRYNCYVKVNSAYYPPRSGYKLVDNKEVGSEYIEYDEFIKDCPDNYEEIEELSEDDVPF